MSPSARAVTPEISNELPGIIRSDFSMEGIDEGTELMVGLLDLLGDVVIVGELLGKNDGTTDGKLDGAFDIVGDSEGFAEGKVEG